MTDTDDSKQSKGMKIAVLIFSAALIIVAAAAVGVSAEQQRTRFPVNGSVGVVYVSWYYPDYEELVSDSDLIVIASVSDKFAVWGTDDGKKPPRYALCDYWIYTCYPFDAVEVLKGNVSEIRVRAPGGTVDGYTMTVQPTPEFEIGDSVLLFLSAIGDVSGNISDWYSVYPAVVFTRTENGTFVNDYYGEITVDSKTNDILLNCAGK